MCVLGGLKLTSGVRVFRCWIIAVTERMWMRYIVINLSEKFAATKGRKDRVKIAERDTCLKAILIRPNPFIRRACKQMTLINYKRHNNSHETSNQITTIN